MPSLILFVALNFARASDFGLPTNFFSCGAALTRDHDARSLSFADADQQLLGDVTPLNPADVTRLVLDLKTLFRDSRHEEIGAEEAHFRFALLPDDAGNLHGEIRYGLARPSLFRVPAERFKRLRAYVEEIEASATRVLGAGDRGEREGPPLRVDSFLLHYKARSPKTTAKLSVHRRLYGGYVGVTTVWRGQRLITKAGTDFYRVPKGEAYLYAGLSFAGETRVVWRGEPLTLHGERLVLELGLEPEPFELMF